MATNNVGDLPSITNPSHTHSVYSASNVGHALSFHEGSAAATPYDAGWGAEPVVGAAIGGVRRFNTGVLQPAAQLNQIQIQPQEHQMAQPAGRRLVQVFIADSNDNVPLEDAVLYTGEQKMTDLNDQELFFEIDIKGVLAAHNEKRVKLVDKKVKERTEFLEPAKIRDLKMVVVTVANF